MSFKDLSLAISYKTKKQNPIEEFFQPVLSKAVVYNVAVGYFSSAWIRDNSFGIAKFATNGGKAKWIVSPFDLSSEDRRLFIEAYNNSGTGLGEKIEFQIARSFDELYTQLQDDARIALAWLIRDKIIEFKMGIPLSDPDEGQGILHSKMGYFKDAEGNELSFSGSYNLTGQARFNWERFDVFKAWDSSTDEIRTREIQVDLDAMWEGKDETLMVFTPSEESLQKFKSLTTTTKRPYILNNQAGADIQRIVKIPTSFLDDQGNLRDYQERAINGWFKNNGHGIFHMATGSGKTATALSAVSRLYNLIVRNKEKPLVIVVTVPFISLAKQWITEASAFNFDPIACFGSRDDWLDDFQIQLQHLKTNKKGCIFAVVVNRSLTGTAMQSLLGSVKGDFLFVGDEMHNLGAQTNLDSLPQNANFRMGLSATPDREYDEEGTKRLDEYFGQEVIEFTINDAIERGYLCKYFYYPILVQMTDDEWSEYSLLTNQISKIYSREKSSPDSGPSPYLQNLIFRRARLLGKAENKRRRLVEILGEKYKSSTHMIVYCGDAKDGDDRQVDIVTQDIIDNLNMRVNKFTSEEDEAERDSILSNFKEGKTQALVAIKCLDEGIDIPKTDTAFILASSTTKRQFIQRRGRVLRKAPGKQYAYLYDFIALPRLDEADYDNPESFKIERQLFSKELERINEFSIHALNGGDTLELLRPIKQRLNLMHK